MKKMNEIVETLEETKEERTYFEENYERTKPLGKLILLVAFTAIMLITSTYAWFSTQRNVTLSGLKGEVNVAEGLQISLDAKHWVNTINFNDFDQTDVTAWKVKTSAETTYLDDGATFQAPATDVTNVVPKEYLPVSTTGLTNEGIGKSQLTMYNGTYTDSKGLEDIAVATETAASGYFAFDLYVMNTSAEGTTSDVLKLDTNSDVIGGNEATGIQNTMRVAFALYGNSGDAMKIGQTTEPTQAQIIAGTSTGKTITDVAIWEPNANKHVDQIVNSTANTIKFSEADRTTYTYLGTSYNSTTGISKFADGQVLPTYALTAASVTAGSITDVYDWATPAAGLKKQITLQTEADVDRTEVLDLISIKKLEANAAATDKAFEIVANQYQKIRVYVWIEGQDPDCINYASLGEGLTLNLGITKGDEASDTTQAGAGYLPTGFSYVDDPETDITIADSAGNKYVWISVPQDSTVYSTSTLALDLDNLSGDELIAAYSAIESDLHTYTSTYRNSTSYTDTWYSEAQHGFASADDYNALKYKMLKSVFENGGFYVGKYEAGTTTARASITDELTDVVIQANAYPYNYVTNKQAQSLASGMASGEYTSSLMFGVQWDLVLKYLETSNAATVAELNSDSTEWGNYNNNTYTTIANSKYYLNSTWTDGAYEKTASGSVLLSTGASTEFQKAGIYDIAGNVYEWTLEYTSNTYGPCARRGGTCDRVGSDDNTASSRLSSMPNGSNAYHGFRVALY